MWRLIRALTTMRTTIQHMGGVTTPVYTRYFPMYTSVSSSGDIADTTAVSIVTAGTYHITAHMTGYCNSYVACSIRVGGNVFNSATQIAYGAQSCSVYGSVTVSVTRALSVGEYIWMGRFAVGTSGTRTVYGDDVLLGGTYYCFHRIV